MTPDITTKLAAIRSIVDDIAVHLASQPSSPIAPPVETRLAALETRLGTALARIAEPPCKALLARLEQIEAHLNVIELRIADAHERATGILRRTDENDAHIEHIEGRLDAIELAWQDHGTPPIPPDPVDKDTPF